MSADNWTTCPQCQDRKNKEVQEKTDRIAAQYGKVSAAEWEGLSRQARNLTQFTHSTLREDFHIGIDTRGEFEVRYEAGCTECGWGYTYPRVEIRVYMPGQE